MLLFYSQKNEKTIWKRSKKDYICKKELNYG